MKKSILKVLVLSTILMFPGAAAMAAIYLDGKAIESFTIQANKSGNTIIVTTPIGETPPVVVDPIPTPDPDPVTPPPPPPPVTVCNNNTALQNAGDINWSNAMRKELIKTGVKGSSSRFKTTASRTYKGYVAAVATAETGNLTRRMWISRCSGGEVLPQEHRGPGGKLVKTCEVAGVEPKLSWSQEVNPSYITQCKLEPNTVYYLNYQQNSFGAGEGPNSNSSMYRSFSASGTP